MEILDMVWESSLLVTIQLRELDLKLLATAFSQEALVLLLWLSFW
jgi:hypothetical protein